MKKNVVIYISIIVSALVIGGAGGAIAKRLLGKENIVYVGNVDSMRANAPEILKRYEAYNGSNPTRDFQTWELINVALEKYRNCEYSYSFSKGVAKTIVEQQVRNYQIKNGNDYFEESLSKSKMVSVAKRMYQSGIGGNVKVYDGSIPSNNVEEGVFSDGYSDMTSNEYENYLGRTLDSMFIYIISEKTVEKQETKKLENGYFELNVGLSPNTSTINYQTQMKNISNLDQRPVFDNVNLTFVVDKDMMLKTLHVNETYSAKMTIEVSITNDIDTYYFPNEKMEIPSYQEKTNYSIKGEKE